MFAVGLLIHTQPSFSQTALSSLLAKLESTASQAGVTLDTSQFSVADVAYSFTIAIIAFGLFLAAISVLGLIGVKYGLKPVLIVVSWSFSFCVCLSVCLSVFLSPPQPPTPHPCAVCPHKQLIHIPFTAYGMVIS